MSESLNKIVGLALQSREDRNSSLQRDLIKGLNQSTEHYAYYAVIPFVKYKADEEKFLRIAGLIASSNIAQGTQSFGEWLLHKDPGVKTGDSDHTAIEDKLLQIINLPFSQAIYEISRIISRVQDKTNKKNFGESFNWFDLANTLYFWGDGVTTQSLKTRQKILKDYYGAHEPINIDGDSEEEKDSDND